MQIVETSCFDFLKLLKKNNNRDWFNKHKERYLKEFGSVEKFADDLLREMNNHDVIETQNGKKSLHRIYRDVRFSKDKTPYNTNWGGGFKRAGKLRRGSYYFHLEPGNSFIAIGFWGPNNEDLKRLRDDFESDPEILNRILRSKKIKETFGGLKGDRLKTTPKGYDANSAAIDLLRFKQFLLIKKYSDREVLNPNFVRVLSRDFRLARPFLDYMSEALTTDMNGVSLI